MYCQLVYICGCLPGRILHALADLPDTLDETYQRILQEMKKAHWELAYRLLQCVAVAFRPLRVDELAEFLAFDFNAGPISKFNEDLRPDDPVDAVLRTCSSLLSVVDVEGSQVIQFSHFSVKEFLTSTRLAASSDVISRRYHITMAPAHALVAQACLGILVHLDENITRDNLANFPLVKYAAKHWVDHVRFENVSQHMEEGMKRLFDPRMPHYAICFWIHHPMSRRNLQHERPLPFPGTPLHYATLLGLRSIVEFLVIEHAQNVHSQDFIDRATPLHLASQRGHNEVVHTLIKLGADVTARNKKGWTPLHLSSRRGHVEVIRTLFEHGPGVKAQAEDGSTALHLASRRGHVEVVYMFLERGTDVTVQDKCGSTPLHLASQWGHTEVTCMLLEHGSGVAAQDKEESTLLHLASLQGHVEIARMLLKHGADISAKDKHGLTPVLLASQSGNVEITRILLERGADLAAKDKNGSTALHLALRRGRPAVACMLLENGADATAQDKDTSTPLHLASLQGHAKVVRVLLKCGADTKAKDKNGLTPLDPASERHAKVVRILLKHDEGAIAQHGQEYTSSNLALLREGLVEVALRVLLLYAQILALTTTLTESHSRRCN